MYREKALIKFRRYFLHAIRDGKQAEEAADSAMWKTRNEVFQDIQDDNTVPDKSSKEAIWTACFEVLTIIRVAFVDYDQIYEERKRVGTEALALVNSDEIPRPATTADAVLAGMEQQVVNHEASKKEGRP